MLLPLIKSYEVDLGEVGGWLWGSDGVRAARDHLLEPSLVFGRVRWALESSGGTETRPLRVG